MSGRVFLYELITGGGMWSLPDSPLPAGSLLREGGAMFQALAADLLTAGVSEVTTLRDARLGPLSLPGITAVAVDSAESEQRHFLNLCEQADQIIVIAPEFDGLLTARARWAESVDPAKLASPGSELVRLASDKWATYRFLAEADIPVVLTHRLNQRATWDYLDDLQVVTKPVDGAGSEAVVCWKTAREIPEELRQDRRMLIQPYIPGIPASVALIGTDAGFITLPPTRQILQLFHYSGGCFDLSPAESQVAKQVAIRVGKILSPFKGYLGVDMILKSVGQRASEQNLEESRVEGDIVECCVVEINPRLTSSYIGLRQIVDGNLAAIMLGLETPDQIVEKTRSAPLEFFV